MLEFDSVHIGKGAMERSYLMLDTEPEDIRRTCTCGLWQQRNKLQIEVASLRRKLKMEQAKLAKSESQAELQMDRTKQLVSAWKLRLNEGEQNNEAYREQMDAQMRAISAELYLFQSKLKQEQKDIEKLLQEKDRKIKEQKETIELIVNANHNLTKALQLKRKQVRNLQRQLRSSSSTTPDSENVKPNGTSHVKMNPEDIIVENDYVLKTNAAPSFFKSTKHSKMERRKSMPETHLGKLVEEPYEDCHVESDSMLCERNGDESSTEGSVFEVNHKENEFFNGNVESIGSKGTFTENIPGQLEDILRYKMKRSLSDGKTLEMIKLGQMDNLRVSNVDERGGVDINKEIVETENKENDAGTSYPNKQYNDTNETIRATERGKRRVRPNTPQKGLPMQNMREIKIEEWAKKYEDTSVMESTSNAKTKNHSSLKSINKSPPGSTTEARDQGDNLSLLSDSPSTSVPLQYDTGKKSNGKHRIERRSNSDGLCITKNNEIEKSRVKRYHTALI